MATAVYIPVEEYLSTSYRPDCDYIDGEVLERNLGTQSHAILQSLLAQWFNDRFDEYGCVGVTEQRVRVADKRVRIPDVCALVEGAGEEVLISPPLVCIEVLSPDDTLPDLQARITDYLVMGIANVWVFDPVKHLVWIVSDDGALRPFSGTMLSVTGMDLAVDLAEIFDAFERRLHRLRSI